MRVFIQDSAHPFGHGKQKHVVTISGRPVGDGQPRFVTRHQPADANQHQRRNRRREGEASQPVVVNRTRHGAKRTRATLSTQKRNRCGSACRSGSRRKPAYFGTSIVKSSTAPSGLTSISFTTGVFALALRCMASTWYLPGGTL